MDPLHRREVDHETSVGDRLTGDVVAAAANRHLEAALTSRAQSRHDIGGPAAARDDGGTPVDHAVMDLAGLVVLLVGRLQELAGEPFEPGKSVFLNGCHDPNLLVTKNR